MIKLQNLFKNIVWIIYVVYLFSIMAFGDRGEYYRYSNVIFVVFILMMIVRIILTKNFRIFYKDLVMLPFVAFSFVSTIWSYDRGATLGRANTLLQLCILCVILAVYLYRTDECKEYLWGFATAGIITTIYVIWYYGISQLRYLMSSSSRVGGEIVNENTLAIFMAISVIFFLQYFFEKKNGYYLFFCIPLIVIIALTGSKKGLSDVVVGAVLSLVVSYTTDQSVSLKKIAKVMISMVIMGIVFYFVWKFPIFDTVRNRFTIMFKELGGASANIDYSTYQRQLMLGAGIRQFLNTPILGIGIGASGKITLAALGLKSYLHNNYVELLATGGIIGTVIYYFPIFKIAKTIFEKGMTTIEGRVLFVLMIILLFNDFAAVQYFSKTTFIILGIAIAYCNKINDAAMSLDDAD